MTQEEFLKQIQPGDVIVLQGIPGSGKSTLAKKIDKRWTIICSADTYMTNDQAEYVFLPWKLSKCHKECLFAFLELIGESGQDVLIVDNTNTTNIEIAPYMAIAGVYNRNCYVVTINIPVEVAIKRQIHVVPADKIQSMQQKIQNSIKTMPSYWKHIEVEGE